MHKVIVIGGGAAGILAGIAAVQQGATTIILEKMPNIARKLMITGKGRCNITNMCSLQELIKNMPGNGRFLYSAFTNFTNSDMVKLLESHGLATKVERGGRVFPQSDKAMDVVDTLRRIFIQAGGKILTKKTVQTITLTGNKAVAVICSDKSVWEADAIVLATGGASYPGTGSTGDGYVIAQKLGHTIVPIRPSLVPLESPAPYIKELQGLSLKNVTATLKLDGKVLGKEFGEMLFTHFGVSGPIILSLSNLLPPKLMKNKKITLILDLKPALSLEKLDARLQRDFVLYSRKHLLNGLKDLLPQSLIGTIISAANLAAEKEINQITKTERHRLAETLKAFALPISGPRPLAEAIVTAGGVNLKEINPKTFASKLIGNVFLAGELLDIDGFTGGYNLQAAFSSGYVAGLNAAKLVVNGDEYNE